MSRTSSFSSSLLLRFDEMQRLLNRVSRTAEGYLPYNVERIAAGPAELARLRITVAGAGVGPEDSEEKEVVL